MLPAINLYSMCMEMYIAMLDYRMLQQRCCNGSRDLNITSQTDGFLLVLYGEILNSLSAMGHPYFSGRHKNPAILGGNPQWLLVKLPCFFGSTPR